jgi:catechol 2,3-dioxygenase-like lactoylglutathione lyase family enzyme
MTALGRIVETCLYVTDLEASERFYADVLGLECRGREAGRHVFFRVGEESVLLLFRSEATRKDPETPHGSSGSGHAAFGVGAEEIGAWRERLVGRGVTIEKDAEWPRGGRSFYFRDPAGNLLEIVTPGVWGLPSGW